MRLGKTIAGIRQQWQIAAAILDIAAFITGLVIQPLRDGRHDGPGACNRPATPGLDRDPSRSLADEGHDQAPDNNRASCLILRIVERMEAKSTAGSSTKPAAGNYLYLPAIDRYYSLPEDVKFSSRH